jgi:AraC family transcriptional regulator
MNSKQTNPRGVPTEQYHKYVPAATNIHIPKEHWGGFGLNLYDFPRVNEGIVTPGIPDFGLAFTISGSGQAYCSLGGGKWGYQEIHSRSAFFFQPHNTIAWQWREKDLGNSSLQSVNIFIDNGIVQRIATQVLDIDSAKVDMPSLLGVYDPVMHQLALELLNEAQHATPYGKLFGETAGQLMAIQLLRKHCTISYKVREYKGGLPQKTLNKVLDYIIANLNRNISLESLSILAGLSSYHFARQFKQSTGLAPHQYIVQCRVEKAKELLKHTNLSITQIALEIGYGSQSHFTSLFKRLTGVTPKEYRNRI